MFGPRARHQLPAQSEAPERVPPALKVWVDTKPPSLSRRAVRSGEGNLEVEWEARDDHLDLPSLALEWRRTGEDEWRSLRAGRMAAGRLRRLPAPGGRVEVRLRVRDRAGNAAEKTVKVSEGR